MRCSDCCVGEVAIMEVRLPLHDPVLPASSFLVGLDDHEDDVPPSPTPDPATPTIGAGNFFQRGFLDCAQEALRFLVEEEGMAEDSPVVAGLKQHLLQSTQHFSQPPTHPAAASSIFSFPQEVSAVGKHHSENTHAAGYRCLTSGQSSSARFAPYTVPVRRPGHAGVGVDKLNVSPKSECGSGGESGRKHPSVCTSTERLESVLDSGVISTDDLHGVLTCLQSVQTPVQNAQHPATSHSLTRLSSSQTQNICSSVPVQTSEESVVRLHQSLNDSGFSEASALDMLDEVDGDCCAVEDNTVTVGDSVLGDTDRDNSRITQCGVTPDSSCGQHHSISGTGSSLHDIDNRQTSATRDFLNSAASTESTVLLSDTLSVSDSIPLSQSFTPMSVPSAESTESNNTLNSSPSSQLSVLTALSSGTHSLTASAEDGSATASRIQSLASQILLLLQEEAEAGEDSDDEDDDLDSDNIDDATDDEFDGDDAMLEVEP